ncbi:NAD(P)H-dependent flavin oxidoreductase [Paraburkholderia sp. EG287A]|uniref:NAD(P)H-dependent flavin oxidoreductase n=1 Tax=unclassified Paraburkholderia TaxID=2615204 RepID=UPI0034D15A4D
MIRLGPTAICRELGARYPVFGFSHSPDVIVALAEAGGFGVLGLAREMPEDIAPIITRLEQRLAGKPYGIDLMLPAGVPQHADIGSVRAGLPEAHVEFVAALRERFGLAAPTRPSFFTTQVRSEALFDAQIEAVLASNARAVATAIGIRPELIARAKAAGKYTISLVGSPRHAQKALALGVDALVAQGADAGGHTGPIGTFSLVPQIVAVAAGRPVLAAGGIGTGAQVAASLAMGAQGAWLGTLWLAAQENHTPSALLQRLIEADSDDTLVTRAHSGKPCRVVRSAWIDAWQASDAPAPLPMPQQQALTGGDFSAMHEYDRADLIYEAAGQSVFAIDAPTTVAAQMATLVADANAALATLGAAMSN